KVLGLAGAALLLAGPALAADLPVRAPVKAPPPVVPVFTWTGFYFGGNIGGVDEHASGTSDFIDTGFPPTSRFFSNPQNPSCSNTRVIGGVQGGYNWQFSPQWVAGFEADWDFTNVGYSFCRQTDILSATNCTDNGRGFETISSKTKWFQTDRVRLGFLLTPTFLVFGTGGVAIGDVETVLTQNCLVRGCGGSTAVSFATATINDVKAGWTAGAGAEYMITPNWLIRGEWLHIDLGTITDSLTTFGSINGGFTPFCTPTPPWARPGRVGAFPAPPCPHIS